MTSLIKLLPDSVANQIAAGEVIQRPASVVKELLENSVDAGADNIKLIIKDAGKTLIQVTDNGSGMSETDARMCFERHATSKINSAEDLFAIRTMGFRGEALASIAAIAHVDIKTKPTEEELGTQVIIEGSKVFEQKTVSCPEGTTIAVKNLFYNVPARRKFLKSQSAEFRHILEEFNRIAFVNENISFSLIHNDKTINQLPISNLRQRIVNIMGDGYNEKIIPVEQKTDKVKITGFVGKPQYAKKTRGEQYFFANKRFIKHPYLHHSVENAFQELLPANTFPSYYIYIDVDPKNIDINIHPTKTEVNFQDNQYLYAILRSAIKQSLGKFNVTATIDFDLEQSFNIDETEKDQPIRNPFFRKTSDYNPFESGTNRPMTRTSPIGKKQYEWEKLYDVNKDLPERNSLPEKPSEEQDEKEKFIKEDASGRFFQVQNRYIISYIKSGLLIIDQHNAHLRILYEKFLVQLENKKISTQQELFPQNITFSPENAEILKEIQNELQTIGFSIKDFGKNTFVIDGRPADCLNTELSSLLESIIENFRNNLSNINISKHINIARSLASNLAIPYGRKMQAQEMENLADQLFSCNLPEKTPSGKTTLYIIPFEDIEKKFKS